MSQPNLDVIDVVHATKGTLTAVGVVELAIGIGCLVLPEVASFSIGVLLGVALLVVGLGRLLWSFLVRTWGAFLWTFLVGLLYVVGGVAVLGQPLIGSITLTLVVAIWLVMAGAGQVVHGISVRPLPGWGLLTGAGVVSGILGVMLLAGWPVSGLWVPGVFVGIEMLMSGATNIGLARAFPKWREIRAARDAA